MKIGSLIKLDGKNAIFRGYHESLEGYCYVQYDDQQTLSIIKNNLLPIIWRDFCCPLCGSSMFGTSIVGEKYIRYCHGNEKHNCNFVCDSSMDHTCFKAFDSKDSINVEAQEI